jgi:hypothetical protein
MQADVRQVSLEKADQGNCKWNLIKLHTVDVFISLLLLLLLLLLLSLDAEFSTSVKEELVLLYSQ